MHQQEIQADTKALEHILFKTSAICNMKGSKVIQEEETTGTFLRMFKFHFERMGMTQYRFESYLNAQPLPDDMKDHVPYMHVDPINRSTINRILSGSIPDADTLYRIVRLGFGCSKEMCREWEEMRYEAEQERRGRTTQHLAIVRKESEPQVPEWVRYPIQS